MKPANRFDSEPLENLFLPLNLPPENFNIQLYSRYPDISQRRNGTTYGFTLN